MTYSQPMYIPTSVQGDSKLMMNFALLADTPSADDILWNSVTTVLLDTGSCGLVVTASTFFSGDYTFTPASNGNPATLSGTTLAGITIGDYTTVEYTSSGDKIYGFHITIPKLALGVLKQVGWESWITWSAMATNVTAVAAVGRIDKKTGNLLPPGSAKVYMCGIGYGRPLLGSNIFLDTQAPDGTPLYASFLLSEKGVWLGYQQNASNGGAPVSQAIPGSSFSFQTLSSTPVTNLSACPAIKGTLSVGSAAGDTTDVAILVDTGLDYMIAKAPAGIGSKLTASGTTVTLSINGAGVSYTFTTPPDGTAGAPTRIQYDGAGGFVNTGFHFLDLYQYYFDWPNVTVGVATYPSAG